MWGLGACPGGAVGSPGSCQLRTRFRGRAGSARGPVLSRLLLSPGAVGRWSLLCAKAPSWWAAARWPGSACLPPSKSSGAGGPEATCPQSSARRGWGDSAGFPPPLWDVPVTPEGHPELDRGGLGLLVALSLAEAEGTEHLDPAVPAAARGSASLLPRECPRGDPSPLPAASPVPRPRRRATAAPQGWQTQQPPAPPWGDPRSPSSTGARDGVWEDRSAGGGLQQRGVSSPRPLEVTGTPGAP